MKIIPRSEWGARHGRGTADPGPEGRVVIHHSYSPALDERATPIEERHAVRGIEAYHVGKNGWSGIAYNWLVAPSGRVYEGRGWKFRGAHAGPVNGDSIGVCLMIDGNVQEPSDAMIRAVRELVRTGIEEGEIRPDYTLSGHRDHMQRECPGEKVYRRLQEFRHDHAATPPVDTPQPGERRWSPALKDYVVLTRYVSEREWYYLTLTELRALGHPAGSPWSKMPEGPK